MGAAKTAGERVREIFLKGGRDLPSCFAVHDYLGAIPADAPEQIAALEARREETIAMCEQLRVEKDALTTKLAGAMGACKQVVEDVKASVSDMAAGKATAPILPTTVLAVRAALADEPPASKRYRAIEKAAEAWSPEGDCGLCTHRTTRPDGGSPTACRLCKALRGEGGKQ